MRENFRWLRTAEVAEEYLAGPFNDSDVDTELSVCRNFLSKLHENFLDFVN